MDEWLHRHFSKKSDFRVSKNYRGITLIVDRFIMPCFSMVSDQKLRKFYGKIWTVFMEINLQFPRFRLYVESSKEYGL